MASQIPRRQFLAFMPTVLLTVAWGGGGAIPRPRCPHFALKTPGPHPHPEPRPGIDASKVLTAQELSDYPDVIDAYDGIRQIPHIADGIRCHCGCAELPEYYSLLTCYEEQGMARFCDICQGQGRLAYRLHQRGWSLDRIREAMDARFA